VKTFLEGIVVGTVKGVSS